MSFDYNVADGNQVKRIVHFFVFVTRSFPLKGTRGEKSGNLKKISR